VRVRAWRPGVGWRVPLTGNGVVAGAVGERMTTLGIIGAGNIGSNVARAALAHGYDVVISNSR